MLILIGALLTSLSVQAASFEEDLGLAQQKLVGLNNQVTSNNNTIQSSRAKIQQNKTDIEATKKKISQMEPESVLAGKVSAAQNEYNKAVVERDRVQAQIAPKEQPLVRQINELESEIEDLERNIRSAQSQISQNNNEISRINYRLGQLGSEFSLNSRVEQLRREEQSLRIELQRQERDAQYRENQINNEILINDRRRQDVSVRIDRKRMELSNIDSRIEEIRLIGNRIRDLDRRLTQMRLESSNLEAQIAAEPDPNVKAQLQARKAQVDSRISSAEYEMVQLQAQQSQGQSELPMLQSRRSAVENDIRNLQYQDSQFAQEIDRLEREKRLVWAQVDRTRQELVNVSHALTQAESDLREHRELSAQLPQLKQHNMQLQAFISSSQSQVSDLENRLVPIRQQLVEVRRPLVAAQNIVDANYSKLASAKAVLQSLYDMRQLIVNLENEIVSLNTKIASLESKNVELRSQIVAVEKEVENLKIEASYLGVIVVAGTLNSIDQEKINQLNLKPLEISKGLVSEQLLKRTQKIVHIMANQMISPLKEAEQAILLEYLKSGGLVVVWGKPEKLLPPKAKPENKITEGVRNKINIETKKEVSITGIAGDEILDGVSFAVQGPIPALKLDNLKLKNKVTKILKSTGKVKETVGTHTLAESDIKNMPTRSLVIGMDFDKINALETVKITQGVCKHISKENPAEVTLRKVCN